MLRKKTSSLFVPLTLYDGKGTLEPERETMLRGLLEYCRTIEPEVIFVAAPINTKRDRHECLNEVLSICEEEGFTTLNFNREPLYSDINMDWETEFYNDHHTNLKGAEKYSRYLCEYIKSNYDIMDHRGDDRYKSWEAAVELLNEYIGSI